MHHNSSAESNRRLPKYDPFHSACWVPLLCCRSPIHHSNILVCQLGPLDNMQTASQSPFVNLSRLYGNRCTREVTRTKWSAFVWLLWTVTRLHAGTRISSLENYVQNIRKHSEINIYFCHFTDAVAAWPVSRELPFSEKEGLSPTFMNARIKSPLPVTRPHSSFCLFIQARNVNSLAALKTRFRSLVHFSCKSSQILPQHRYLDCQDQRAVLPWIQRSNWLCSAE